jgi:hypothetical protein
VLLLAVPEVLQNVAAAEVAAEATVADSASMTGTAVTARAAEARKTLLSFSLGMCSLIKLKFKSSSLEILFMNYFLFLLTLFKVAVTCYDGT